MTGYFEPNKEAQLNVSNFTNKVFIFNNGAGKNDVVNVGDNTYCTVRILPPWSSNGIFLKKVGLIWNLPEEGYCFVSPGTFDKPCPFQLSAKEIYDQRKSTGDKKLHEQDLNTIRPKFSYYGRVVVFEENGIKYDTPVIKYMRFGVKTYDMIMTYFKEGTGGVPLTGLQKGLNIKVIATGSGLMKSYVPVPIPSDFDVRTIDGINNVINLDNIFQVPDSSLVYKAYKYADFKTYKPSEKILRMVEREYGNSGVSDSVMKLSSPVVKEEDSRMYNIDSSINSPSDVKETVSEDNVSSSLMSSSTVDSNEEMMKRKIEEMRAKLSGNKS